MRMGKTISLKAMDIVILLKEWRYKRKEYRENGKNCVTFFQLRGQMRERADGQREYKEEWKKWRWEGCFLREQFLQEVINNGIQNRSIKGHREG